MRFSDIGIALMTLAVSVYGQGTEQPVTNLNDVRPGHIEDMAALPYEIQRCINLNVPMAWHFYPDHLDLFCDKNTGNWHQDLPICIANAFPSSPAHAISLYNIFSSSLCRGYAGPGMPLTTLLTVNDRVTISTIFPTPSETSKSADACSYGTLYRKLAQPRPLISPEAETAILEHPERDLQGIWKHIQTPHLSLSSSLLSFHGTILTSCLSTPQHQEKILSLNFPSLITSSQDLQTMSTSLNAQEAMPSTVEDEPQARGIFDMKNLLAELSDIEKQPATTKQPDLHQQTKASMPRYFPLSHAHPQPKKFLF
ncbi:hypothetical protein M436DRAFT_84440 [Aureobasidium namibiae CBS 147.97]|uniref:Sushi domain-containing protein n=1 Tax=Aureobasidium namibiae CBS 147.97 TaxID=1043004 RepID=A0A074WBL4_9PEZI